MNLKKLVSSKKVLVVGDVILDHYIYGKVYRVSPEAPVPVVLKSNSVYCLGGSANVAQNVTSFGSECYLLGVTGDDPSSKIIEDLVKVKSISPFFVKDPSRETTEKTRIVGNGHQITRIDSESTELVSESISKKILEHYNALIPLVHGVIVQDYGKGMLTPELLDELIRIARFYEKPILVDPKDKDFSRYAGANWIKPNLTELKNAAGIPPQQFLKSDEIEKISLDLISRFCFDGILVTMSEAGMIAVTEKFSEFISGHRIEVTDVSGAGDTVSAVFLLMQICGLNMKNSIGVSNLAGSMVCQISGAVPIDSSELLQIASKKGWI